MTSAGLLAAAHQPATPEVDGSGLSFPHLVRSEWLKLKTLRSTWITLGAAIVVLILAAGLIANHLHGDLVDGRPTDDPNDHNVLTAPLRGFGVTQLIMGVLGVLAITGEYATGMIRATLTAVPKRLPVLWAKVLVFAVIAFVAMCIATFASFFTAEGVLGSYGVGLGAPHALRVVLALSGFLALVGLLGLGLGFMVRSTAGGIAALVGLLLVAPGILAAFRASWATTTSHYLPLNAGQSMFSDGHQDPGALSPGAGTAVMVAWVVAAIIGAAVLVERRDA